MSKYFKQAIEIIANVNDEQKEKLLISIAKNNPASLVKASNSIGYQFQESWELKAREFLRNGELIQAVKHCRDITGMALKEAKEAVDKLR